jgi:hypothetical protein
MEGNSLARDNSKQTINLFESFHQRKRRKNAKVRQMRKLWTSHTIQAPFIEGKNAEMQRMQQTNFFNTHVNYVT